MKKGFFGRRVAAPLMDLLRQGITPEKLALSLAFGIVLGIFPVIGSTTVLCTLAAVGFRLNLPAIQLVNYLVYPLQIIFLIPFLRMGDCLFGVEPIPLDTGQVVAMFKNDFTGSMAALWHSTLRGIVAWGVVAIPAAFLVYLLAAPLLRRLLIRETGSKISGPE